jgi:hypothetical protein
MSERQPSGLRLVSTTNEVVLRKRQAFENVKWTSRAMAANLIALAAGAGCSNDLLHQIRDLAAAIDDAEECSSPEHVADHLSQALKQDTASSGWSKRA